MSRTSRVGAWAVYALGILSFVFYVRPVSGSLDQGRWMELPIYALYGLAHWWIVAGIAIRLGLTPREALKTIATSLLKGLRR